jgi:hypothetical protein
MTCANLTSTSKFLTTPRANILIWARSSNTSTYNIAMAGSPSATTTTAISKRNRRRGDRSVTGCLTCRRRRVKCASKATPCENCSRLHLTCTSSFDSNFKNWTPGSPATSYIDNYPTPVTPKPGIVLRSSTFSPEYIRSEDRTTRTRNVPFEKQIADVGLKLSERTETNSYDESGSSIACNPRIADALDISPDVLEWLSHELVNSQFDPSAPTQDVAVVNDSITHDDGAFQGHRDWLIQRLENSDDTNSKHNQTSTQERSTMDTTDSFDFAFSPQFEMGFWDLPPQMPPVYGNSHGDLPLLRTYETNMPNLLTSKVSLWNPYRYMLDTTKDRPNSPLRHAILNWVCSYLTCREQNQSYSGAAYYVLASSSINDLIEELSASSTTLLYNRRNGRIAEKLYMLLSTAFFLSNCDLMLCDYVSLHTRLASVKDLFQSHWAQLALSLGTLESRLLIWLAYLDLRSSLFTKQKQNRLDNGKPQSDLLKTLVELDAFPSLRWYPEGQSYLSESFGESYPKDEIEEDLVQEPCHLKCDDILSIFSSLNAFETWNDEFMRSGGDNPMMLDSERPRSRLFVRTSLESVL